MIGEECTGFMSFSVKGNFVVIQVMPRDLGDDLVGLVVVLRLGTRDSRLALSEVWLCGYAVGYGVIVVHEIRLGNVGVCCEYA